jgi:hypothetical protein
MQVVPSGPSQNTAGDVLDADTIIKRGSDLRRLEKALMPLTSENVTP